ncbi:MAG: hypothetical protein QOK31_1181 [Solirubrobacteraceae bacterium]|nr:hypothetical protein [Solirubrobacteraceae bacterium]
MVQASLGNSPWTVFAQGLSRQLSISIGLATIVVSFGVLLAWVPLRQRPGLGTIANAVVIGLAIDATLDLVSDTGALAIRAGELLIGIGLVGLGSGLYLGTALGPGPRDGLMTGLHRQSGLPVGAVRVAIELSALAAGWGLGGEVGIGTVAFAVLIGPLVAAALRALSVTPAREL